jgi:hypothetical protein
VKTASNVPARLASTSAAASAPVVAGVSAVDGASKDETDVHGYDQLPETLIRLARTQCFGPCPVYSVAIRGDGRVFFYGNAYTKTLGYAESRVSRKAVAALLEFLHVRRYLSLPTEYPARATDHPSANTMLRQATVTHKINHDLSNNGEPALREIEEEIDRVAASARWVGPAEARPSRNYAQPPRLTIEQLRSSVGRELASVERACVSSTPAKFEVTGCIDGDGRFSVNILSSPKGESGECVTAALSLIEFPFVDVCSVATIPIFIHP